LQKILLDPYNEAELPNGFKLINTELSFLENALSNENLFIKEIWLCKWAETFFKGRDIEFKYSRSITNELLNFYDHLTQDQAVKIFEMLKDRDDPDINLSPRELMNGCYPNPLWLKNPSIGHSAEWLLWLFNENPENFFEPIIKQVGSIWIEEDPELARFYNCLNFQQAEALLHEWICYLDLELIESFGSFPIQLPPYCLSEKVDFFNHNIIQTNGKFILNFLEHESSHQDKLIITSKSIEYFEINPDNITREVYLALRNFATDKELEKLNKLQPVSEPRSIPSEPDQVFLWFQNEYLPFRQREVEVNDEKARRISLQRAQEFSFWYLDYYPRVIIKGKNLAPHKAHEIKEKHKDYVTLFIILDGLNVIDSKTLINSILSNDHSKRLDLVENSFVFSLIPTVTEFTKKHLVNGSLSIDSEKLEKLGVDIPDNKSPIEVLSTAQPGEIVIWRIQEPDNTYHSESKSVDLQTKIKGQLVIISERIKDVVRETPLYSRLRIVITTDHGRLLGKSHRVVKVPQGMLAHGRAAWGNKNMEFDHKGYLIEDNLVFLSDESYYLDGQTVAVILTDQAFEHDTYSEEISPHGGLFPEEVILPWLVFERNNERPSFFISITGAGQANKEGEATLRILNTSTYKATLLTVYIDLGIREEITNINGFILPKADNNFTLIINSWPSVDQTQTGSLKAEILLPNGEMIIQTISLKELKSESMYSRDNILEDLL
jgi:hypothetical protein